MTDRPILFSAPMIRSILREIDTPGTGWDNNPWVAAITFTPRLGNIDSEGV